MIWIKAILNSNNAEGCREAVRLSYKKHLLLAEKGTAGPVDTPHAVALYGALGSRYIARGMRATEFELWPELLPFLLMNEADSVEALAEYVVYQERPNDDVIFSRLQSCLNAALRNAAAREALTRIVGLAILQVVNRLAGLALRAGDLQARGWVRGRSGQPVHVWVFLECI